MPKLPVSYADTYFNKIVCNDLSITDFYVGHTTNFANRKNRHKTSCNSNNMLYVYSFIRDHGGWDNFDMILLDRHTCNDKLEALRIERKYIEDLKPTLNRNIPTRTRVEWVEDNKEHVVEYKHQWSMENKDKVDAKHRQTYVENREETITKVKAYYEKNKDKCHEWKNMCVNCECGFTYTNANKARHEKSQRHQQYLRRE